MIKDLVEKIKENLDEDVEVFSLFASQSENQFCVYSNISPEKIALLMTDAAMQNDSFRDAIYATNNTLKQMEERKQMVELRVPKNKIVS